MNSLNLELQKFIKERDWEKFHTPKNLTIGLSVEVSELLEIFIWKTENESENLSDEEILNLKDEIGDIFIYLNCIADKFKLDLSVCAIEKLEKNKLKYPVHLAKGNSKKYNKL